MAVSPDSLEAWPPHLLKALFGRGTTFQGITGGTEAAALTRVHIDAGISDPNELMSLGDEWIKPCILITLPNNEDMTMMGGAFARGTMDVLFEADIPVLYRNDRQDAATWFSNLSGKIRGELLTSSEDQSSATDERLFIRSIRKPRQSYRTRFEEGDEVLSFLCHWVVDYGVLD